MTISKSRILIIGATGYIGSHFTKASLAEGHPTFLLVRESAASSPEKAKLLESFHASGANILHGSLDDYASLVEALKKVDVVISAVGDFQHMSQMNIIKAIKEVGNIKRFLPSEYGFDYDRFHGAVGPIKITVDESVKIRRAVEAEHIPYTYIVCSGFAEYFVPSLGQADLMVGITLPTPHPPPTDKISIYGDGKSKAAFVQEEDIATYTIKTVDDPRTLNKSLYFMPPADTMSANELVGVWEKMIGKTLEKDYVSEEKLLKKIADAQSEVERHYLSVCHYTFMKGDLTNFDVGPHGAEASQLYPNVPYTTVEEILSRYV